MQVGRVQLQHLGVPEGEAIVGILLPLSYVKRLSGGQVLVSHSIHPASWLISSEACPSLFGTYSFRFAAHIVCTLPNVWPQFFFTQISDRLLHMEQLYQALSC